jgi:type VI secretion system protein ImpG
MSDELLPYYHRELSYVRKLAARFAEQNPRVAERLRVGNDGVTKDPHVERLIEGFAYLTARIRRKLDDDFPELTDALLGTLYPHYLAPIPSMTTFQFRLDKGQADLAAGYTIPRGARLETEPVSGEACRFRTAYPVTIWPIEVSAASLGGLPFSASGAARPAVEAVAALRIELRCLGNDMTFAKMAIPSLRFHLAGQDQYAFALYELIFNNTVRVSVATLPKDPKPLLLERKDIKAVGFDRDEGLLPLPGRSFPGYRLLSEYFAFPRKFLYFDLCGLAAPALAEKGNRIELTFFLNRSLPDLEQNITRDTFRLGCTPAVNLFAKRAEPLHLTQTTSQIRLIPDARSAVAHEVYSVDGVTAASPDGERVQFRPFHAPRHDQSNASQGRYWLATRRPSSGIDDEPDEGTEVDLALVHLNGQAAVAPNWTLEVETTCTSRDLPNRLPFGGGRPRAQLVDRGSIPVECLSPPTPTLRPALGRGAAWRLISHLNLNHLSLTAPDENDTAAALREVLRLYDGVDVPETRARIESITGLSSRRIVARAGGAAAGGFCRGVEVTLKLDESKFGDRGGYLFAAIVERFLALYCSINSFSQLIVTSNQREREWCRWPPRAGEQALL